MTEKKSKKHISPLAKRAFSHLFNKPATMKYPFVKPQLREDFRGEPKYTIKACNMIELSGIKGELCFDVKSLVNTNCEICYRNCPADAIKIVEVDGKKRPQFDLNRCIFCNQCVDSCPRQAITGSTNYELATTDKASLIKKPNPNDCESA